MESYNERLADRSTHHRYTWK